jgi:hypothetical protein
MDVNATLIGEVVAYLVITITCVMIMRKVEVYSHRRTYWAVTFALLPGLGFVLYLLTLVAAYVKKTTLSIK